MNIGISIFVFLALTGAITLFGYRRYVVAGRVYENLERSKDRFASLGMPANPDFFSVTRLAEIVGRKIPASASAASALRLKLLAAGYRNDNAVAVLYGFKLIGTLVVTCVMIAFQWKSSVAPAMRMMGVMIGMLAGFRLPDFILARQMKRRQKALRKALPDALDLIIVCAEAGLTTDRSFRHVSQQLAHVHPELSDEFSLFTAELNAGLRRREALENLAFRTQETEIRKFVAVLTQADRFGTSMGEALRTHAEYLRVRRRQDAEEKASKVSVKMIFPIFFFIMPCMMLVTVGPAVFVVIKQLVPLLNGGG